MSINNQLSIPNYNNLWEPFLECKEIIQLIIFGLEYSLINQFKIVEGKTQADKLVDNFLNLYRGQLDSWWGLLQSIVRFQGHQVDKEWLANKKWEKIVEIEPILKIQEGLSKLQMMWKIDAKILNKKSKCLCRKEGKKNSSVILIFLQSNLQTIQKIWNTTINNIKDHLQEKDKWAKINQFSLLDNNLQTLLGQILEK